MVRKGDTERGRSLEREVVREIQCVCVCVRERERLREGESDEGNIGKKKRPEQQKGKMDEKQEKKAIK